MVRLKTRYLLFEVLYPDTKDLMSPKKTVDGRKMYRSVRQSVLDNFGDFGLGQVQASLALKYYNPNTLTGILRVSRDHVRLAHAALTYLTNLDGQAVIVRVIRVSGTIKKNEQAAIARDKDFLNFALQSESSGLS